MTEVPENMEDVCKESNDQTDRINYLIKEFTLLKETIKKFKKNRYDWELYFSTLTMHIWAGQVKYTELQKKEAELRSAVSETIKISDFKEQELKSLTMQRTSHFFEQCNEFQDGGTKHANNFLRAQGEYTSENLFKDIHEYREKCNKISHELLMLKETLRNLETLCGFNDLNFTGDTENIMKINNALANITANNNSRFLKITSTEGVLKKLKNEIKENKKVLDTYPN
ncbi:hypothetical protein ANTPLA_LOCUS7805 [Anthophora plagiata]